MTWRNASYSYLHAARTAGAAAITPNATVSTDFPKENLIDDRMTTLFKWTNSAADHTIDIDLGASGPTGLNRLYIPIGHNLNGMKIRVDEDDDSDYSSMVNLHATELLSSDDAVDITFDQAASSERYLRVSFPDNAGAHEIGQLWITTKVILTKQGPDRHWIDELLPNVIQFEDGSTIQEDVDQRFVEYTYRALGRTPADLTAIEALVAAVSTYRPFILDSLYEENDGGYTKVMKLTQGADARHDSAIPRRETRKKQIVLSMLEHLL